ncbi:MAG: hypothetical protein H6R27_1780 [Proteobacteria bacterium]|nr:hypothetical protein [Pseudomonadota bacterium]
MKVSAILAVIIVAGAGLRPVAALGEPYLAVEMGFKCGQCHANPTGGGLRNLFGNAWSRSQLSARNIGAPDRAPWLGQVNEHLSLGGDLRADAERVEVPGAETTSELRLSDVRLYVDAQVVPGRLSVYVDERLAPGNATTMEAYARLTSATGSYYLKAGRMYLPFGWRLEDDNALVRQLSGINMQAPDEGVEVGLELDSWSAQLALSNGSAGGPETDDGKQLVTRIEVVWPAWRFGVSGLVNDADAGTRTAVGLFAGMRLGPTNWLAEADYVDDEGLGADGRQLLASLIEANWQIVRGHNLKITYEWLDPDTDVDEDEQSRSSVVYEWSPIEFVQVRAGVRQFDGPSQIETQNRTQIFLQLHGYF